MALAQRKLSFASLWLDNLTFGKHLLLILGIGAIHRRRIQSSEDYFLSGRSLHNPLTRPAFLGANLGAGEILGHLRE